MVRASDQSVIDRQGILVKISLVAGSKIVLFTSKHSHKFYEYSQAECFPPTLVPRPTCANSRYHSRLDHSLATRPRNSQQTIRGTVIRSNRGGTSTATKNKRKTWDEKRFYATTVPQSVSGETETVPGRKTTATSNGTIYKQPFHPTFEKPNYVQQQPTTLWIFYLLLKRLEQDVVE